MTTRYEFIDGEKACTNDDGTLRYTITKMCEWLEDDVVEIAWLVVPPEP